MTTHDSRTSAAPVASVRHAPGAREWGALAVLTLAVTLLAIDSTVLSLAIPSLSADLSPTASQLLWIGDIYSFVLAGLLVTMGNLADRVGRRRLLLIGTAGFGASSVLAALAPSAGALIAARALLGLSGATIMPSTLSLVRTLFPDLRTRATAIAIWSAGSSGGMALGPVVGGLLLGRFWWGSVFLINVPVMVLVVATGLWLLPESRNAQGNPVDLPSAALSVMAVVPMVYAVKSLAHEGPTLLAVVALAVGTAAGWAFLRRQRALAAPLVDLTLFARPAFTWAVLAIVMTNFALVGLLYFFSQYLQLVRGMSTFHAGLTEVPAALAAVLVVAVVTWALRRLGYGGALGCGLVVAAAGMVLIAAAESYGGGVGLALICMGMLVAGAGVGLAYTVSTGAVLGSVPPERAGAASAVSETGLELGAALGIAVLGTVQDVGYRLYLGGLPQGLDEEAARAARQSLPTLSSVADASDPVQAALLDQARTAFTHAMQTTAVLAAVILVVAGVMAARRVPARGAEPDGQDEEGSRYHEPAPAPGTA